jgi:superfamily II DNA or RNA helicase
MTPITIAHTATTARLVDASKDDKLLVQQLLSYKIEGYVGGGFGGEWDGRSSFFDFGSSTFPAGFVTRLYREFGKLGRKANLVRRPLPPPLGPVRPVVDAFPEDPRYDYQTLTMDTLVRFGQIIAQVATGGGKSRIAKLCFSRINRPTLFLTTRGILMHQMRDAFVRDLRIPVGIFGDDHWDSPQQMNVGMVQTFAARLAEPDPTDPHEKQAAQRRRQAETIELLQRFEFLILEEAHEASSDSYYVVSQLCRNAHYRLALTATPDMRDSEQANMRLEATAGPVAIKVSEQMLIERGILARPYFKYIDLGEFANEGTVIDADGNEKPARLYKTTPYQKAYEIGISTCTKRNAAIVQEVVRARAYGLTSMVLVQHKAHGARLARLLTDAGVRCAFIQGANDQDERLAALNALKTGLIDALIGTNILDVGVDTPAVGLIAIAGAGKAEVAYRQRIGRGLREKKNGMPNAAFIVDFMDRVNNHLRDHARERRLIVETTPGFGEGIVSDFPFEQPGFVKRAA